LSIDHGACSEVCLCLDCSCDFKRDFGNASRIRRSVRRTSTKSQSNVPLPGVSLEEQSSKSSAQISQSEFYDFCYSPSGGLDMSKSEAAGMASSLEVQKLTQCGISKSMLEALRSAMYSPNCLDMSKSDIKQQLLRLAYLQLSPDNLQALRNALYSPTGGLDLDKKTAASRAVELAIKQVNVSS